jgi:hypothetical protein
VVTVLASFELFGDLSCSVMEYVTSMKSSVAATSMRSAIKVVLIFVLNNQSYNF